MKLIDFTYSNKDLKKLIKNQELFYAHLSNDESKKETLIDHILLVQSYFFELIEHHRLNEIIIKLISGITKDNSLQNFIAELFVKSIAIHDFGKVNPKFQKNKMKNNKIQSFPHNLSSGHSLISGYIFSLIGEKIAKEYNFSQERDTLIDYLCLSFSYPILKHHSPSLDSLKSDLSYPEKLEDLSKFTNFFSNMGDSDFIKEINKYVFGSTDLIFENIGDFILDKFALFALLKLNYSLLTASDYLATTHFMNNFGKNMPNDFGVFDNDLKTKIISRIETSTQYNKKTYKELENYQLNFSTWKSNNNLNKLRQNLSVEIINGIRKNLDKNLFYIEAPTGGGKTNLSVLALAEFLRNDLETGRNSITKVFYVFPFTTLITQTFKSLKETLGLDNDEIVQIHSKAGFSQKGSDDKYGKDKLNIIDYQFVNYPIALLSHIKFFDILKSNRKSANYLMHRLANSVVIIDELQAYSPKEWDKVIYFINKYAQYFNIKFILMSATLPKIDELLSKKGKEEDFEKENFIKLNQNKDRYFQNPNFAERVEFDFSMLNNSDFDKENKEEFLKKLWGKLVKESESYKKQNKRVHTIIEFIFKKSASKFMTIANEKNNLFDEIFLLSGTILEPRRKEIIAKLKSKKYQYKSILLITTQVVEAGVDIDMDLGFKDTSLIDSDEQLAGRINRNVSKEKCKLFLFDYDDAKVIYGKDYRYKTVKEKLKQKEYHDILQKKNFGNLYSLVMKHIKYFNEQDGYTDNLPEYLKGIKKLNFDSVYKDFQLINNSIQTVSLFVPIKIPVKVPNSEELNFALDELKFLKEKNKYNDEEFIEGENIWELYCDIIENKDSDFIKQKRQKIIMQGLIAKFSFSIGIYSKNFKFLSTWSCEEEKYGFYKLNDVNKFYDYHSGIKKLEFKDTNFF